MEIFADSVITSSGIAVVRLVFAAVIGFVVGINREKKRRGAGTRTHALVCMSSCLVMLTSEFLALNFPGYNGDVARLGAQVISGMGFIGAGTIIITRYNHIRGLTTAASLWATACLGLAIGAGFVSASIAAAVIMLIILISVEKMDKFIKKNSVVHDYLIVFDSMGGLSHFLDEIKAEGIKINNIELSHEPADDEVVVIITLETKKDVSAFMLTLESRVHIRMLNELLA